MGGGSGQSFLIRATSTRPVVSGPPCFYGLFKQPANSYVNMAKLGLFSEEWLHSGHF